MRRTLVRLATATSAVLGAAPPTRDQHDCRFVSVCWPGQHRGWYESPRNVGG
jgi:hypothetical protein